MAKRLFVDMDGTLARFHDEVQYLERMWEPGFFRNLQPFDNMVNGIKEVIGQHPDVEVYILSSKILGEPPYCEAEKNAWLDEYLPEIDAAHRIFPATGTSKADVVPGGITAQDYLLDDYNKSLREWEAAGGRAIKCHNNINHRGLGVHGGEPGKLWTGAMAHTTDRPELIAAELARHMGEPFDLQRVAAAYDVKIGYGKRLDAENAAWEIGSVSTIYEATRGDGSKLWYTYNPRGAYRDSYEMRFINPLNAIRSMSNPAFFELPMMVDGELRRFTRAELYALAENFQMRTREPLGDGRLPFVKDWGELRDKVEERLKEKAERKPVVGRVSFANGEKIEYTDPKDYIKCIKEELLYRATSGFYFETLTDDPQTRKAVDDLIYNEYGEENPMTVEDYALPKDAQGRHESYSIEYDMEDRYIRLRFDGEGPCAVSQKVMHQNGFSFSENTGAWQHPIYGDYGDDIDLNNVKAAIGEPQAQSNETLCAEKEPVAYDAPEILRVIELTDAPVQKKTSEPEVGIRQVRAEKEMPADRPSVKAKLENLKKAAPQHNPKHHDRGAR